jgi:hypothetical protein
VLSLLGKEPIDLERLDLIIGRQLIDPAVAPSIFQLLLRKALSLAARYRGARSPLKEYIKCMYMMSPLNGLKQAKLGRLEPPVVMKHLPWARTIGDSVQFSPHFSRQKYVFFSSGDLSIVGSPIRTFLDFHKKVPSEKVTRPDDQNWAPVQFSGRTRFSSGFGRLLTKCSESSFSSFASILSLIGLF